MPLRRGFEWCRSNRFRLETRSHRFRVNCYLQCGRRSCRPERSNDGLKKRCESKGPAAALAARRERDGEDPRHARASSAGVEARACALLRVGLPLMCETRTCRNEEIESEKGEPASRTFLQNIIYGKLI
ncbi:unnamed protein product [Leptosia nina]|uniref:Uncharacterized protein n=1 Tax=Leptosia nina TaxID=320188 RepID=A0AAV1JHC6_9NEOP